VKTRRPHVPSAHRQQPVITACPLRSCCSIYFSSRYTELTEHPLVGRSKSNIKLITSFFLYILCSLRVTNRRLISNWSIIIDYNLIVPPDTSTFCMASRADWLDYRIGKLLDWSSDWLIAIRDGMISVTVATRILIRTYKFGTANKTLLPLCIFVSLEPLTHLCETHFEKHCSKRKHLFTVC
jgi:hypothetical protein